MGVRVMRIYTRDRIGANASTALYALFARDDWETMKAAVREHLLEAEKYDSSFSFFFPTN